MHVRRRSLAIFSSFLLIAATVLALGLSQSDHSRAHAAEAVTNYALCSVRRWEAIQSGDDASLENGHLHATIYGQFDSRTNKFCGSYYLGVTLSSPAPVSNPLDLQFQVDGKSGDSTSNINGSGTWSFQTVPLPGACAQFGAAFFESMIANAGSVCAGG